MPITAPYGAWRSPVSSDAIASASVRISEPRFDSGALYWLESRPAAGGRYTLVRCAPGGAIEDVTRPDANVRTRAHEYGGGSFLVSGDTVFYVDYAEQRLMRQDKGDEPLPISPAPDVPAGLRYADMRLTPDGRTLLAVQERHTASGRAAEVVNEVVALPVTGGTPHVVATGHDFYAAPRVSPDGRRVCWLQWDHPAMPWDSVELVVADLAADGVASNARVVAGGPGESIFQPEWSPEGALHFVSDRTGWWNLYRLDGEAAMPLAPLEAEFGQPGWVFGMSTYAFLSGGRVACVVGERGVDRLGVIVPDSGAVTTLDTPFSAIGALVSDGADRLALVAGGPTLGSCVATLVVSTGELEIVRRGSAFEIDLAYISTAEPIEYPTTGQRTAHALYYAPVNPNYVAPAGELPPLLVMSHGGPTGQTTGALNASVQFWTTRGIAVVDVNYGGSTGYGRAYRERLKGNWGIVDIDDCVNAARYLVERGQADGARLAIRGGSAGGYTTLAALTFTAVFATGASYYGVSDLAALARDTHKFESRYLDGLVGPWPAAEAVYTQRSPIHHTERLAAPMIIFQGLEDAVVPPSQAEMMVAALDAKGLPYAYIAYEGEQHGFRRAENIKRSLDAELYFYGRIFGFEPADAIEPVDIKNLT